MKGAFSFVLEKAQLDVFKINEEIECCSSGYDN
jgi:hypothetical protein